MLTLYHSRAGRGERPTDLASARLPANVAWLDLLNPVPDETSPQPLGSGRRNDPPPLLADDACQEPKVCRLTAGGNWIRNSSSALPSVVSRVSEIRNPGRGDGSHRSSFQIVAGEVDSPTAGGCGRGFRAACARGARLALTAPKGIPIPRSSRCDRLVLFGDRRKAQELPRLLREDVPRWRERIRTLGPPAAKNSAHTPLSLSHLRERRLRSGCHSLGRFRLLGLPLHRALGEHGFDGLRFGLLFERLHASAHHLEERPAWHGLLGPVQKLRGRVDLVVVFAVGEHRQLMEVFGEPGRVLGNADKAVLDHRGLGMHAHDLVGGWLIPGHTITALPDQLLDQLGARSLVLDQHNIRPEQPLLLPDRALEVRIFEPPAPYGEEEEFLVLYTS